MPEQSEDQSQAGQQILEAFEESEDTGPTPSDPEGEPSNPPSAEAEPQKSELDTEVEATSETEVEDTQETEETQTQADEPEEPEEIVVEAGESVYKGDSYDDVIAKVEEGVEEKDKYINELTQRVEETEEQFESRLSEVQEELAQKEAQLQMYEESLPGEERDKILIEQTYMPEEYRGKTLDDFESEEEKEAFKRARWEAERDFQDDIRKEQERLKQTKEEREKQALEARKQATQYVDDKISYEDFRATNPEDRNKVDKYLNEKVFGEGDQKYSRKEAAIFVAEAMPEELAEAVLKGLQSDFVGDTQERVKETVEESKQTPTNTDHTPPPKVEETPMTTEELIESGFTTT